MPKKTIQHPKFAVRCSAFFFLLLFTLLAPQKAAAIMDPDTGLIMYRHRHYSPDLGRFISRDPIQQVTGELPELTQGSNLYAYVRNNPLNAWDKLGLAYGLKKIGEKKVVRGSTELHCWNCVFFAPDGGTPSKWEEMFTNDHFASVQTISTRRNLVSQLSQDLGLINFTSRYGASFKIRITVKKIKSNKPKKCKYEWRYNFQGLPGRNWIEAKKDSTGNWNPQKRAVVKNKSGKAVEYLNN